MAKRRAQNLIGKVTRPNGVLGFLASILFVSVMALNAPAAAVSPEDQHCLSCHQNEGMEKPLANGESLSLHIAGDKFGTSVHGMFGCAACHSDIDVAKHPNAVMPIASKREFSITRSKVCATCHTDQATQWSHSVHAALVKDGNPLAPVCTSCHSPHAVIKGAAHAMETVPCKTCHSDIFDAYATSVHGTLRTAGITQAPLCYSCHGAHDVKVPTAGAGLKATCFGCHKDAEAKHKLWLPNAQLHFTVISCPACHSPTAHRKVDLALLSTKSKDEAAQPIGVPEFEGSHDSSTVGDKGLDPATLFTLMQTLNRAGVDNKTTIKGRLTVSSGVEAHKIAAASEAIKNCATCHKAGSAAFQSVTISVAGSGGVPVSYGVNKDVLHSAFSIPSIGGFYAMGATRIMLLDVLLVLGLLVGFGIPALHLTIRWLASRPSDKAPPKTSDQDKKEG